MEFGHFITFDLNIYQNIPTIEDYNLFSHNYSCLMSYRNSRRANLPKLKQRSRILLEARNFHMIELDIQSQILNIQRRSVQIQSLEISQRVDDNNVYNFQNDIEADSMIITDNTLLKGDENDDIFISPIINSNPRKMIQDSCIESFFI